MKKQSQILRLWHTANFWAETNNDGKNLDLATSPIVSFEAEPALVAKISAFSGSIISDSKGLQVNLPIIFESNTINASILALLPNKLVFYIKSENPELLLYAGLLINSKKLRVQPNNNSTLYSCLGKSFTAKTLGASNLVADADLVDAINNYSLNGIKNLIGQNISTTTQSIDIKVVSGANIYNLAINEQFLAFSKFLKSKHFEQIPLAFRRQTDNSLLKDFASILVLPETSPKNCLGIIIIPKASLTLIDPNPAIYQDINHFMLHLPAIKYKLDLSLTTNAFENGSKLFYNTIELNATVANHPNLAGFKLLSLSQSNIDLYIAGKRLSIQKAQRRVNMDIEPIKTLNISTKTSKISILKTV